MGDVREMVFSILACRKMASGSEPVASAVRALATALAPRETKKEKNNKRRFSNFWRPQFMLPEHGAEGLEEIVYYIDYQGVRIIVLNSNERLLEQARWLEKAIHDNPNNWTVVTFHHPVFSSVKKT